MNLPPPIPSYSIIEQIKEDKQEQTQIKEPVKYIIVDGDNLTKIASEQHTSLLRLWAKNTNVSDPNKIEVGLELTVPLDDEVLPDRPMPVSIQGTAPASGDVPGGVFSSHPIVPGNLYEPGQCVWFVKNRRPDIPNNWSNASSWLYNAQAQGWATGAIPRAGAVGWTGNHVVYVESVHGDTITISEMNYDYVPFHQRTIDKPANSYTYIY